MKFTWKYRYVKSGIKPDRHGMWALNCYIMDEGLILIATITMSGSYKEFGTLIDRFRVEIPSCDDMYNTGIASQNYFADNLEDLKRLVEEKFENLKEVLNRVK